MKSSDMILNYDGILFMFLSIDIFVKYPEIDPGRTANGKIRTVG